MSDSGLSDGEYDTDRLFTPEQLEEAVEDVNNSLVGLLTDNDRAGNLLNLDYVFQHAIKYDEAKNVVSGIRAVARTCWKTGLVRVLLTTVLSLVRSGSFNVTQVEKMLRLLQEICITPVRGIEKKLCEEKVGTALLVLADRATAIVQPLAVDVLVAIAERRKTFCTELAVESLLHGLLKRCHKVAQASVLALFSTIAEHASDEVVEELVSKHGSDLLRQIVTLVHSNECEEIVSAGIEALTAVCVGRDNNITLLKPMVKNGKLLHTVKCLANEYDPDGDDLDIHWQATAAAHDFMEHLGETLRHVPPTEEVAARRIQSLYRGYSARKMSKTVKKEYVDAAQTLKDRIAESRAKALQELIERSAMVKATAIARERRMRVVESDLKTLRHLPPSEAAIHWERKRSHAATTIQKWWKVKHIIHVVKNKGWSTEEENAANVIRKAIGKFKRRKQISEARKATYLGTAMLDAYETAESRERKRNEIQQRILDNVALSILNKNDDEKDIIELYRETQMKLSSRGRLRPLMTAAHERRTKMVRESADYCRQLDVEVKMENPVLLHRTVGRHAKEWLSGAVDETRILNPSIVYNTKV